MFTPRELIIVRGWCLSTVLFKVLYSDCLRPESNFLASMRPVTALCVCVCCIASVCDWVMVIRKPTRKQCNIRTCTRQWLDTLKPKSYSLVKGNKTIVCNAVVTILDFNTYSLPPDNFVCLSKQTIVTASR